MLSVMKDAKKILDDNNVFFWLDGGSLLWAYRDHTPDMSDTDFGIFAEDRDKVVALNDEFIAKGFTPYHIFRNDHLGIVEISFSKNGHKVDLFVKYLGDTCAFHIATDKTASIPYCQPLKHFETTDTLEMGGEIWNTPCDVEDYLKTYYGNWQDHVSKWDWRTSSPCINMELDIKNEVV